MIFCDFPDIIPIINYRDNCLSLAGNSKTLLIEPIKGNNSVRDLLVCELLFLLLHWCIREQGSDGIGCKCVGITLLCLLVLLSVIRCVLVCAYRCR